jgi:hypothetical protein
MVATPRPAGDAVKPIALAVLAATAVLAGCAAPRGPATADTASAARGAIVPFSALKTDDVGPWTSWRIHPTKPTTAFRPVSLDGSRVLEAVADRSVSGLKQMVDVDPAQRPIIEWRWRIDQPIAGADVADRYADDAPVRVVLAFEGDTSTLPMKDQMFIERAKLLTGQDLPYATLMYVWCNKNAAESVVPNAHFSRVQKIVVQSGEGGAKQWLTYRRDFVADYERAFGQKPGRLIAIGVMSDSDNTKQMSRSWYGDIRLLEK